ncbi:XdhC family protein [Azohydromonas sp.]|uniref:XdhC family protein n=1 Tax=Azohydromonas sp. TaxID=1872666 RepID=UPI002D1103F2|nr:XdhC family protein [Azohydromonas sp.]HMM85270.1 XdhC family protein [Azohydromonas sp.]
MENLDLTVLRALRDWRAAGRHALLATVVHTWGSSPRPVGSILALRDDGVAVGSVSGGCIEDDLIARHVHDGGLPHGAPRFVRYGVTADEAHRFGLPCGGTLELLLEFDPDAATLAALVERLEAGALMRRRVCLADGAVTLEPADRPEGLRRDDATLAVTFGPEYRLLLIGAGQLAEYVATMALFSGFRVAVCDPRSEYRDTWAVPGVALSAEMPDDAVRALRPDRRSAVVALTHDPKLDDLALIEALGSEAFYVGAIGSRRNNDARRVRLAEHFDVPAHALARLRGPIGLFIGSKTPAEIAVSVMAELLAVKNGVALPPAAEVATAKAMLEVAPGGAVLCGAEPLR